MTYLVRDMLDSVASYLGGTGIAADCPDGQMRALRAYNDMTRRLMLEGEWEGCSAVVRIPVYGGHVTLNRRFQTIKAYSFDGVASAAVTRDFEFLGGAYGRMDFDGWSSDLTDAGDRHPLMRDLPRPMRLIAVSDRHESTASVQFSGLNPHGRAINATIPVRFMGQAPEFTSGDLFDPGVFDQVTAVRKTRTVGYVNIYGWDPERMEPEWLSTMAPDEESASLRRYRVPGGIRGSLRALVLLRWVPLYDLDEVSLIQLPDAFQAMGKAMDHFARSEIQLYKGFLGEARRLLGLQIKRAEAGAKVALNVIQPRRSRRRFTGFRR